ncbi:hypothetical protein GGR60_001786 [Xanthomonas arboricola]|uniref:hypothetical protein n=1 Tax=Xanthomonas euroxanthea TaxID=2259622 RepID=UPI0014320CCC|nr:hypothetical protein [Xanthomonas euroxanthea]NJC37251.1 hypothetical protein [Xanthomonas euroxanthea]
MSLPQKLAWAGIFFSAMYLLFSLMWPYSVSFIVKNNEMAIKYKLMFSFLLIFIPYLVFRTSRTVLGALGVGIFIGGLCGLAAILIVSIASSGYTSLIGEMKRSGVGSWFFLHFMIAIVLGGWTVGGMIGLVVGINFKKTKSGVMF